MAVALQVCSNVTSVNNNCYNINCAASGSVSVERRFDFCGSGGLSFVDVLYYQSGESHAENGGYMA